MPSFTPPVAQCTVIAYKEGLLSAVGHDVALSVQRFAVEVEGGEVEGGDLRVAASFDADSLSVIGALPPRGRGHGAPDASALSDKDKRTIEGYVRDDILKARANPKIRFVASEVAPDADADPGAARWIVEGALTLHGRTRTVRVVVAREGEHWVGRASIHQPDFGITPFKAMLGTLRIQPKVDVELRVPASALPNPG